MFRGHYLETKLFIQADGEKAILDKQIVVSANLKIFSPLPRFS